MELPIPRTRRDDVVAQYLCSALECARTEFGPLTVVQFIVPLDRQEAKIAFYDEWTESQSDEYQLVEGLNTEGPGFVELSHYPAKT